MWIFYFKYMAAVLASQVGTSALSVLYCCLTPRDFNVVDLYRPGKYVYAVKAHFCWPIVERNKQNTKNLIFIFSLPWNQTTPAGYFAEMCVSILFSYVYLILTGIPLLLFISMCIHHQAFLEMFKHWIGKSVQCDAKLLCDLIRFHISAKE